MPLRAPGSVLARMAMDLVREACSMEGLSRPAASKAPSSMRSRKLAAVTAATRHSSAASTTSSMFFMYRGSNGSQGMST